MENVKSIIEELWKFLEEYLPLANTHGAEFISQSHWEKYVPVTARDELLTLSKDELVDLPLKIPRPQRSEDTQGSSLYDGCFGSDKASFVVLEETCLEKFLQTAQKFHLPNVGVIETAEMRGVHESAGFISEAMSEKKCHEVELMSAAVKTLFDACGADVVIDLGSGKGYLSTDLSRQHGIPVLGLDSSQVNTHGAVRRDARLGKKWDGLDCRQRKKKKMENQSYCKQHTKKTQEKAERKSNVTSCYDAVRESCTTPFESDTLSLTDNNAISLTKNMSPYSDLFLVIRPDACSKTKRENMDGDKSPATQNEFSRDVAHSELLEQKTNHEIRKLNVKGCTPNPNSHELDGETVHLEEKLRNINVTQVVGQLTGRQKDSGDVSLSNSKKSRRSTDERVSEHTCTETELMEKDSFLTGGLYVPLTMFVQPDIDLRKVIQGYAGHLCGGKDVSDARLLVTGLHTCGSLAVTGIQLFLQDPGVAALCMVGCCYQLMEEQTGETNLEVDSHFPLSEFGKKMSLHLGRNARNLASQSVHRIQASKQLQGADFYWRALLDVLLHDLDIPVPERIMGMRGLNKRCSTFIDYAQQAFKKLNIDADMITPERVAALESQYKYNRHKMTCFFQLKLALAPVIESLILLDRLLYLLEQGNVSSASLVQLFDPMTSPRCFAILARKVEL